MPDPTVSTSPALRRERALADARRRLRRLEIETHRIKAELARLEAENEDDIADELADQLAIDAEVEADAVLAARRRSETRPAAVALVTFQGPRTDRRRDVRTLPAAKSEIESLSTRGAPTALRTRPPRRARRSNRPALWSLALHTAILLLCLPWSFAVITNDNMPVLVSSPDLVAEPIVDVEFEPIELVTYVDEAPPDVSFDDTPEDLSDQLTDDLFPLDDQSAADLAATLGQLDALPTDVGTLMAGAGSGGEGLGGRRGSARGRGRLRGTSFFGAEAIGDRFVFLVDNSASMKQGRMETTLFELMRSVDAMSDQQSFYVVFYSDQVYPMYYPHGVDQPVPATRKNKQQLLAWLQTVELCIGGKLADAMDLTASLESDIVFILSDGDITSSRTIERLTRPGDGSFVVHTLGMGVKNANHAANLAAIARTHRGEFRVVKPTPAAVQLSRRQPIKSNPSGVAWGMGR
jgi:hypothetical protein